MRTNKRQSVSRSLVQLFVTTAFAVAGFVAPAVPAAAQSLSYTKGQMVAPAYEGWEEDADGARFFVFGYMNKNWEEELDVPIGAANGFAPGDPDRGQPTHFLPRRNRFVFRVAVPQGFGETDELVWTLTTHGKTMKAYASLRPDYKMDTMIRMSETGALGAGTSNPTLRSNKPPTVRLDGPKNRTVKVGEAVTLVATIVDDGIPKALSKKEFEEAFAARARLLSGGTPGATPPASDGEPATPPAAGTRPSGRGGAAPPTFNPLMMPPSRVTVGKNLGLHLSWTVYRGAGGVEFEPAQIKTWEDTRAGADSPWAPFWFAPPLPPDGTVTTEVKFLSPGTYVLRAIADDGGLTSSEDVTIVVTNSPH
jgi:hypothetical protein